MRDGLAQEGVKLDYAVFDPAKRVSGVYVHLTEACERILRIMLMKHLIYKLNHHS